MSENCPTHEIPFKFIPPGTSKRTGRAYKGFWICPQQGCKEKPDEHKPAPAFDDFDKSLEKISEDEKWDDIGKKKNRSLLASTIIPAFIRSEKPVDWKLLSDAEAWALTGKIPTNMDNLDIQF